jgi:hypothetical protein
MHVGRVGRLSVLGACLVTAAALTSSGGAAAVQSTQTTLHLYSPFGASGVAAGIHISKRARGYCWTGSLADPRSDAWRCFLGNFILDPCFSRATLDAASVLCAESPWSSVVRLTLTRRLPRRYRNPVRPLKHRPPWALRLTRGKKCTMLTGATDVIAGQRINYGCAGGGVLLGLPDRASRAWTIFFAAGFQAKSYTTEEINQAWW